MAAGGFREFLAGETLDEADINDYLMQGVLVFAGTAARGSAIGTAVEGQFAFLKDSDQLTFFDGSQWTEYESGVPYANVSTTPTGSATIGGTAYDYWDFTSNGSLVVTNDGLIDVVVVGGGGNKDNETGVSAGGGGGGVKYGLVFVTAGTAAITIGAGGSTNAGNGSPSSFGTFMQIGGGEGGFGMPTDSGTEARAGFGGGGAPGGNARAANADGAGAGGLVFGSAAVDGVSLNYNGSTLEFGRGGTGTEPVASLGHGSRTGSAGSNGRVIARIPR